MHGECLGFVNKQSILILIVVILVLTFCGTLLQSDKEQQNDKPHPPVKNNKKQGSQSNVEWSERNFARVNALI